MACHSTTGLLDTRMHIRSESPTQIDHLRHINITPTTAPHPDHHLLVKLFALHNHIRTITINMYAFGTSITSIAILALSLATNTSARPVDDSNAVSLLARDAPPAANGQSCKAKDWEDAFNTVCQDGAVYTVRVGVNYANGSGCQSIENAMNTQLESAGLAYVWQYSCKADSNGNTVLSFSTCQSQSQVLNAALHSQYPMVNGFNCPDY